MQIIEASKSDAPFIARMVMMAMTDECCLNLSGPDCTLDDFARVMCRLTAAEGTQYSYRNALLAVDDDQKPMGAVVSYDGGQLRQLRKAFIAAARDELHIDHSHMPDEATAGEWYIDSLAVEPQYRRRGVARSLLQATAQRGMGLGLAPTLLVDKGNPQAERLYRSVGFEFFADDMWGGHAMRRLRMPMPR